MAKDLKTLDLMSIRAFYTAVDQLLKDDNMVDALKILYDAMPRDLYDKSLDILDNRNDKIASQSLRRLITRVDKKINPTLIADEENVAIPKDDYYKPEEN